MIPFFNIDRSALGLTFDVTRDIGDDDLERPAQTDDGGVDRPRP
jgi:hypothetical protein